MARVLLVLALSVCVVEAIKMKVERPRTALESLTTVADKKHYDTAKKFVQEISKAVASTPMNTKDFMKDALGGEEEIGVETLTQKLKEHLDATTRSPDFMLAVHEKVGTVCAFRKAKKITIKGEGEESVKTTHSETQQILADIVDAQATYLAKLLAKANSKDEKITMTGAEKICGSINSKELMRPTNPILKPAFDALGFACESCSSGVEDAYKAYDAYKKNYNTCSANVDRQGTSAPWSTNVEDKCRILGKSPGQHSEAVGLYLSTIQDYLDDRHTANPEVLGAVKKNEDNAEWREAHPPRPHYPSDKDHLVDTFPISELEEILPGGLRK